MNILKVQTDFLKLMVKGDKNKVHIFDDKNRPEWIGISEGHYICFIPKYSFFLKADDLPRHDTTYLMTDYEDGKLAQQDVIKRANIDLKMRTCVKLKNEDTFAWVDESRIKVFDKYATFYVIGPKKPVYVLENDELVGIVIPAMVRED